MVESQLFNNPAGLHYTICLFCLMVSGFPHLSSQMHGYNLGTCLVTAKNCTKMANGVKFGYNLLSSVESLYMHVCLPTNLSTYVHSCANLFSKNLLFIHVSTYIVLECSVDGNVWSVLPTYVGVRRCAKSKCVAFCDLPTIGMRVGSVDAATHHI